MIFSKKKLSTITSDKDFYRLFFIILCFLNLSFHFLYLDYAPQSFDPGLVRIFSSALCLVAFGMSYWDGGLPYTVTAYFALIVFLGVNNCYLLGQNNYIGEYFFGS